MNKSFPKANLELLNRGIRKELERSIQSAINAGTVFHGEATAAGQFATAVDNAITSIETRGNQLKRFLELGPYEGDADIPPELENLRLSDKETTATIAFIYCHIINSFQGALTELLAAGRIAELVQAHLASGILPNGSLVFMGDSILIRARGNELKKGADAHVFSPAPTPKSLQLVGVIEIKSYHCSYPRVLRQLKAHVARADGNVTFTGARDHVSVVPRNKRSSPILISVFPAAWRLQREFWFDEIDGKKFLRTPPITPPPGVGGFEQVGPREWRITLAWSREAIAAAAYELTYWYMGELGTAIYRHRKPEYLKKMTPREAGHNTAKMMLYYAISRCRNNRERQRAIALYNTYGFGYALGMNFRDKSGKRQMLWPEDLHELAAGGVTKHGDSLR